MEDLLRHGKDLVTIIDGFDESPCPHASVSDINWEKAQEIIHRVDKNSEFTKLKAQNLGILISQNSTCVSYGGMLLFGKNRSQFVPDAVIRCIAFSGTERVHSIDHRVIDTYLPDAIEEAVHFIRRNTSVTSTLRGLRRIDSPQFPPDAVREALVNAVLHADYAIKGASINIAVFQDRLEITNPGALPYGINLADALAGVSRIRNRVIARTFYLLELIEQWGSGFKKIIDACAQAGHPKPQFQEIGANFRVTLYSSKNRNLSKG